MNQQTHAQTISTEQNAKNFTKSILISIKYKMYSNGIIEASAENLRSRAEYQTPVVGEWVAGR